MDAWYQSLSWTCWLLPLAWLFQVIVWIRRSLYRLGIKKSTIPPVPLIVVGNITVGGTGKTPCVIALTKQLQEQGFKPGIVSRGYKSKASHYPQTVTQTSRPEDVGDEAFLIFRHTQVPMVVDPNRVRAVETLLANHDCDIVISDDGLQHYAMGRTFEIVVVDGQRGFGNGYCLPAGPLREPLSRLETVDAIIINRGLASDAERNGKVTDANTPEHDMHLKISGFYDVANPQQFTDSDKLKAQTIHAVAGIGNPQRFFQLLQQSGFTNIIEHVFPDHHDFQSSDLQFGDEYPIIMTEKDAVKCQTFAPSNSYYVGIEAVLPCGLTTESSEAGKPPRAC